MIALFLLAYGTSQLPGSGEAVELCKPALARKAGGEIVTIDVADSHAYRGSLTIQGTLTSYAQMGPAPAGIARTHHVGRVEFSYVCEVRHGRVRKTRLNPFSV